LNASPPREQSSVRSVSKPGSSITSVPSCARSRAIDGLAVPAVERFRSQPGGSFQVLIGTLLSARTQDATTAAASGRLFAVARTPQSMAELTVKRIEKLIYPVASTAIKRGT
jgi:endonuclease III